MHARLLALICLLYVSIPAARAQVLGNGEVAVYLSADSEKGMSPQPRAARFALQTGDSLPGHALEHMKAELEDLMRSVGVDLYWWSRMQGDAAHADRLVVLELRGKCQAPPHTAGTTPIQDNTSLGSSPVADGFVQPFSRLDCDALTRFIGPALAGMTHDEADRSYGRAMARVAA